MNNNIKTYTNLTFDEAVAVLNEQLPEEAYVRVEGAGIPAFTDIKPAFLQELVIRAFGPCGLGWGYDFDAQDVSAVPVEKTTNDKRVYTEWVIVVKKMVFWFSLFREDEQEIKVTIPVITAGDARDPAFAGKGTITYGIGQALSRINAQSEVYKGHVEGKLPQKKYSARTPSTSEPVQRKPAAAPATAAKPAAVAKPAPTTAAKPAPVAATKPAPAATVPAPNGNPDGFNELKAELVPSVFPDDPALTAALKAVPVQWTAEKHAGIVKALTSYGESQKRLAQAKAKAKK